MKQSQQITRNYAQALMELTNNDLQFQELLLNEIKTLDKGISQVKDSWSFFNNPGVSKEEKKNIIKKTFSGKINEKILNFLLLLIDNKRFNLLPEIHNQFNKLVNKSQGTIIAEVYSTVDIDTNILQKLKQGIEDTIGSNKKVEIESKMEPSLIGGIKVKINDHVYDGSIKSRLENLKQRMGV